ncbi:hypothetical protein AGMMS50293_07260 [Spirochaetia bacterium]|nr:hypothetical protein AGMMS50293_07260 [Spirochaetia bacterium]
METNPAYPGEKALTDLSGMAPAAAKEYLFGFISTLKLTEKQAQDLDAELSKWTSRVALANSRGRLDLVQEAEQEVERIKSRQQQLIAEAGELKLQIEEMRRQLPLLAARERSIDPDLLEQELLMAAGYLPGEEDKARSDRLFSDIEKEASADAALLALKAKMETKK